MKKILCFVHLMAFALLAPFSFAAPPQTINYQGYITSPIGTPVNTSVQMTFRLYNAPSGGGALWTETQPSVGVINGSFSATLGAVTPIPLPFDVQYWFSVAVNADAEMSPRQPLTSSPYAFRAASLDSSATISAFQVTGGIQGQLLAGTFGQATWTASPTLSGTLTLQNNLELAGAGTVTRFNNRFIHNSGSANTFVGVNAGSFGASGSGNNTAVGDSALQSIGTGANNTAVGSNALSGNSTNGNNTAVGTSALRNNSAGSNNVALGNAAGNNSTSGNNNVFIGNSAGTGLGTGSSGNIMIGNNAGTVVNTGSDSSIYIGNTGNAVDFRAIRIGTVGTQLTTAIAGIFGLQSPGGGAVFINASGVLGSSTSSRRYKDTILDMDEASSALTKLRPVTFYYKTDKNPAGRELQYGLIAEEVNDIYPGLVAHGLEGQIETVMYQFLPPMLLNEFQKQQRMIAAQAARLETLEGELREIKLLLGGK